MWFSQNYSQSGQCQFAKEAQCKTLDSVPYVGQSISSDHKNGKKSLKVVYVDFRNALNTLKRQKLLFNVGATNPPNWLHGFVPTLPATANTSGQTIGCLVRF